MPITKLVRSSQTSLCLLGEHGRLQETPLARDAGSAGDILHGHPTPTAVLSSEGESFNSLGEQPQ